MPITLNHSNISVQYSTGSNYIIETVKSDLYRRNDMAETIARDNLQTAPVTPIISIQEGSNIYAVESYTYSGSANTRDFTRVFTKSTTCDILIVGGGGAGGNSMGGGGGAGGIVYTINQTLQAGNYTIGVGKGGTGLASADQGTVGVNQDGKDSFIQLNGTDVSLSLGGVSQSLRGKGGGGGGVYYDPAFVNGRNGGSGGGCSETNNNGYVINTAGSATQGNTLWNGASYVAGGKAGRQNTTTTTDCNAGGGGGAGNNGSSYKDGNAGVQINITGTSQFYAGGGGGGQYEVQNSLSEGIGGSGIGGTGRIRGSSSYLREATSGTDGTGSGGGGGAYVQDPDLPAGNGGSGIVIIRYLLGTIPGNNLLITAEPTVSPSITSNIIIESFTYTTGTDNTTYTKVFSQSTVCDIMIVAGGGGGGQNAGAGGGAGGLLLLENLTVAAGSYQITVGRGGAGGTTSLEVTFGEDGKNSTFGSYTAIGGGGGANSGGANGRPGGSGGGTGDSGYGNKVGGAGTAGQGNKGGDGTIPGGFDRTGGGGGGAGAAGQNSVSSTQAGNGGVGRNMSSYFGTTFGASGWFAGGGGGGVHSGTGGTGGTGGGGNENTEGVNGTGGGGGAGRSPSQGKKGGSGIVIIRYRSLAQPPVSINMNKTLNFNYYPTLSPTIYTINFPTTTVANVNNSGDKLFNGTYTLTLGSNLSTLVPIQNQISQDTKISSSSISISYSLLNQVIDPIGSQWTYSSSNTNVYHLGNVGIGTTTPEYTLDVRGAIYSSTGGYTSSTLTKWSVLSDRRIKENIVKASYDKCLENVKNIELYNFNFKDNCVNTNDRHQLGFIAQEVQQVYPKAVEVSKMIVNLEQQIDDLLTLNITQIDYTLYGAVKSLIEKIENIKIKLEHIKTTYDIP
jgi:hypothetical protein